jgi:hypothetical protein
MARAWLAINARYRLGALGFRSTTNQPFTYLALLKRLPATHATVSSSSAHPDIPGKGGEARPTLGMSLRTNNSSDRALSQSANNRKPRLPHHYRQKPGQAPIRVDGVPPDCANSLQRPG